MGKRRLTFPWVVTRRGFSGRRRRRLSFSGKITALDLDSDTLRVVQTIRRGRRIVATRFAAEQLQFPAGVDLNDPAVLGVALGQAMRRMRLRPGPVVMGVPRTQVILRTLSLPSTADFGELAGMIHFQIAKDLPFRAEEAAIDFKVHGSPGPAKGEAESKMEVLVAAVPNDVVQTYQRMAEVGGFKLAALGLRSYANARCVEACRLTEGGAGVALVSLRANEVIIDVLAHQALVFSRVANLNPPEPLDGGAAMAAAESAGAVEDRFASAVTLEVVRSLHSYEGTVQQGRATQVVVSGSTGQEDAVVAHLRNRLSVPCSLLDPSEALGLPEAQRHHAPGALAVFGLGLGMHDPEGLPFDFLNPKRPPAEGAGRRLRMLAVAATAAVLVIGLLAVRHSLVREGRDRMSELASQLKAEEQKRPVYLKLPRQAVVVQGWMKERRNWLDHYAYLSRVLPASRDIYVSSLTINNAGEIRLALQARTGEILAQLDRQLRAAGYDVKPLAITPVADKHGYGFKTTVELDLPARMRIQWEGDTPQAGTVASKLK